MKMIEIRCEGDSPIMMNNGQTANELNPYNQELKELTKEKKRKGADSLAVLRQITEVEFESGLYWDEKVGIHVEAMAIKTCIQEGAKLTRGGKTVERSVQVSPVHVPLQFRQKIAPVEDWDTHIQAMKIDPFFRDQRMVKVGQARVLRTRPIFHDWSLEFRLLFNTDGIDGKDLLKYARDAGVFMGLLDGRGKLGMGRFSVKVKQGKKWVPVEDILSSSAPFVAAA
jgi:hypothetical protein